MGLDFFFNFLFSKEKEQTWRWVGKWGMSCDNHRQRILELVSKTPNNVSINSISVGPSLENSNLLEAPDFLTEDRN